MKKVEGPSGVYSNVVNLLKVSFYKVTNFTADDDGSIYLIDSDQLLCQYNTDIGTTKQVK